MQVNLQSFFYRRHHERATLVVWLSAATMLVLLAKVIESTTSGMPVTLNNLIYFPLSQWLVALLLVPVATGIYNLRGKNRHGMATIGLIAAIAYCSLLFVLSGVAILLLERLLRLPERFELATLLYFYRAHWPQGFYYLLLLIPQFVLLELIRAKRNIHSQRQRNLGLLASSKASELSGMRYRMSPHFLFNSLNNISMIVRKGEHEKAVESLVSLGQVLSKTMNKDQQELIELTDELALIRHLTAIEKLRNSSFEVSLEVDDEAKPCKVPVLFLQPLVENAFKYSAEMGLPPYTISLKARVHGGRLQVCVFNSGSHMANLPIGQSKGIGLSNTIHRLRHTYGTDFSFTCKNKPGGVEVAIEIPATKE